MARLGPLKVDGVPILREECLEIDFVAILVSIFPETIILSAIDEI